MSHGYTVLRNHPEEKKPNGEGSTRTSIRRRNADCDIISFAAPIQVVDASENDPKVDLNILRMGAAKGPCSFKFHTVAGSGKPGKQYIHTEGEVTMKDGEADTQIVIPILDDPQWNATLEFQVHLARPVDCELGALKNARVKVIDGQVFPTNALKEQVSEMRDGEFGNIGEFKLFWNFCKLCFALDGVRWRTAVVIFLDQLKNAYKYMYMVLGIYMIDEVLDMKSDADTLLVLGHRLTTAYVVAGLIIIPVFFFFLLDHLLIKINCGGKVKSWLTKSLFRKYMNYSTDSQDNIPTSEQARAVTKDVGNVTEGYVTFVSMFRLVGKIGMSIFFTLQQNRQAWWAVVTIPGLILVWGCCRTRKYITALDKRQDTEDRRNRFVTEILTKVDLVSAYCQRPQINQLFADKCDELSPHTRLQKQIVLTNKFFPEMLGPLFVAMYTALGANLVLQGHLRLGVYLATISVFGDICGAFTEMFGMVMDIISTFTSLKFVSQHLNMETDLKDLMQANENLDDFTTAKRRSVKREPGDTTPRVDMLQIEVSNVDYDMPILPGEEKPKTLFKGFNFTAPQGKIIAVAGKSRCGRRTFLEMLTMGRFPKAGTVFIPAHLRSVFISSEVILLKLSLWQNLVFGNPFGNPYRVEKILKHLRLTKILSMCQEDLNQRKDEFDRKEEQDEQESSDEEDDDKQIEKENLVSKLSETERAWIHLARGFVMNPELMVLHRPFTHFHGKSQIGLCEEAFKMHRDTRGLLMDPTSVNRLRPRTIIFSSDNKESIQNVADLVWVLPKEVGGECIQYLNTHDEGAQRVSLSADDV